MKNITGVLFKGFLFFLLFGVILLTLYRFFPAVNSFLTNIFDLLFSVSKIFLNFIRLWFLAGLIIGIFILYFSYRVLSVFSGGDGRHNNIQSAKKFTVYSGSLFAISALITDSLEGSVRTTSANHEANQSISIKYFEGRKTDVDKITICELNAIYENAKEKRSKSEENVDVWMSDQILKCTFKKKHINMSDTVISRLQNPEAISGENGVDFLLSEIEANHAEVLEIISLLPTDTSYKTLDLVKVKEKAATVRKDFLALQENIRVSNRINQIQGLIFVGIGVNVAVLVLSFWLFLLSSTNRKLQPIRDAMNWVSPKTILEEVEMIREKNSL